MINHNYEDHVKAKAREELQYFIKQFHSKAKRRKGLKVATFLGPTPEEELDQIWDPLDIQRQNITCLEADPYVAKLIESRKTGTRVILKDANDFFKQTDDVFNVINLDYDQTYNMGNRQTLWYIAGRGILGHKGVLATWFVGAREADQTKSIFNIEKYIVSDERVRGKFADFTEAFERNIDAGKHVASLLKEDKNILGALQERGDMISRLILRDFRHGKQNIEAHPLSRLNGVKENYDALWENSLKEVEVTAEILGVVPNEEYFKSVIHSNKGPLLIGSLIEHTIVPKLLKHYKKIQGINFKYGSEEGKRFDSQLSSQILVNLLSHGRKGYDCESNHRLKYVSKRGTPMFVDFFYFKMDDKGPFERFISYKLRDDDSIVFEVHPLSNEEMKELDMYVQRKYASVHRADNLPPRIYLGSSCTRPSKLQIERTQEEKEGIYFFLEEGFPDDDIIGTYDGLTRQELAAYKAHLTMRKRESRLPLS
ncbi:MAG: hypothetical protein HYX24_01220 [Candidatus Aenigmarchaeota archaeon]|nr:hypothetical protein [Candidatus Aenigmarchaeota archaeon]